MSNNKYLPIGSKIVNEYMVSDILGEDDFEILYLVKDNRGSFFVLKELFLETFSSRVGESIVTIPEAEGVFNKRKAEIIEEVNAAKGKNNSNEIKIYGFLEDNDTIYTIMEFENNSDLESYLQFQPKNKKKLPTLADLTKSKKKINFFSLLLKLLIVIAVLGLGWFGYEMFKENFMDDGLKGHSYEKELSTNHPMLQDRTPIIKDKNIEKLKEEKSQKLLLEERIKKENIEKAKEDKRQKLILEKNIEQRVEKERIEKLNDENLSFPTDIPLEIPLHLVEDNQTVIKNEMNMTVANSQERVKDIVINEESDNSKKEYNQKELFIKEDVDKFLKKYISASAHGSIEDILVHYDEQMDRYFNLRNMSLSMIKNEKIKYNKKWTKREFEIVDFKIIKRYKKDNIAYCNIETNTKWYVSNSHGKKLSGMSKGYMLVKSTVDGFKIKSIYTIM